MGTRPKLYYELARWWQLLSAPADYEEEAGVYLRLLRDLASTPLKTVLELGSGGGNNASYLKAAFDMTLVDLSEAMLEVSKSLNPDLEHVAGDMRTVRLGRTFDAVFVHDAISYMTTEADLAATARTIAAHLPSGGPFLIAADDILETFEESTEHGGEDGEGRSLRYLMWTHRDDPEATAYVMDFAYLLKEGDTVRVEHDRHVNGVFPRRTWIRVLGDAGLDATGSTHVFSDDTKCEIFAGVKR